MMKFALIAAAAASLVSTSAQPLESRAFSGGELTFYEGGLTACGTQLNTKSMDGVAVSFNVFDTFPGATGNPNKNPICKTKVRATHSETGVTLEIPVVDKCQGCKDVDLDATEKIFKAFGFELGRGRVAGLQWDFIGAGSDPAPEPTKEPEPTTTAKEPTPTTDKPEPTSEEPAPTSEEPTTPTTTTLLPVGNVGAGPSNSEGGEDPTETQTEAEPSETQVDESTETQVDEPTSTQVDESTQVEEPASEPTEPSSDCISTWTSCNERFDGTEEAIKNYKCHTEYVQCVDAQLKTSRGLTAKRMHRRRLVGLGHSSF